MVGPTPPYARDPRVDVYIERLPEWQQAVCQAVRDLVHAADPDVLETIKRTVQPYFVLDGNICAPLAAKDHFNVFLTIPEAARLAMFRQIIANNRAGGWRRLKG